MGFIRVEGFARFRVRLCGFSVFYGFMRFCAELYGVWLSYPKPLNPKP